MNLFLVLYAVLKERSATRAAKQLNLTQSAVSNALARLRIAFNDPLVVRSGRGLSPTPRAIELLPSLESAIGHLQIALSRHDTDPALVRRCFTLACADGFQICDVPKLVEALSRRMPRASLRVVSIDYLYASNGLESGEVDALIATRRAAKGLHFAELYHEDGVLIVRRDHPQISKRISRELFNSLQHVDVMITSGQMGYTRKLYEVFLKRKRLSRQVILTVPTFSAAAMTVARTDYVAAIPRRVAIAFSKYLPLKLVELPFRGFFTDVALIWHSRTDADPSVRHFRATVLSTLRG
ncbi:MAG: LysR family transcriptional regulator [Acidobacteriota bacterium]